MLRVLIVEDDNGKIAIIKSVLIQTGVLEKSISVAGSVIDAINSMKLVKFDIVVLDMNLPIRAGHTSRKDSGINILREIENGKTLVPHSVIGVTGYDELQKKYESVFKRVDFNLYSSAKSDEWEEALTNKVKWLVKTQRSEERLPKSKVIVTVHGIRTAGVWQENLQKAFDSSESSVVLKNFKAPYISALRLLFPWLRGKVTQSFSEQLDALSLKYPDSDFYFFSHSFGTYILAHKLLKLKAAEAPNIKTVVLAGSVLKRDFPWSDVKKELSINRIINDCGIKDKPLILSEIFAPGLGMAGRMGFYSLDDSVVENRRFNSGHSFFEESDNFYKNYWLPIIINDEVHSSPEFRTGKVHEFANCIIDSIKSYTLLTLVGVAIIYFI